MSAEERGPEEPLPFTLPSIGEEEVEAVVQALRGAQLGGNGVVCRRVQGTLAGMTGTRTALLTPSATCAMEIALLALGIGPGDEVLMPGFAFVSQANAILARGAVPVFCDVTPDTLNLDPEDAARRVSPRTKMVMPVHYAGIASDMDRIAALAEAHGLRVVEDAAQAIGSSWGGRHLGTLGDAGAISFHVTKNIGCGEGGALLVDDEELARKAEIIQEKGTNRSAFLRGEVDKYTWVGAGGSYVLSDLLAALLEVQLARAEAIQRHRRELWDAYHEGLAHLEAAGRLRRPTVPAKAEHNAHIYYVLLESPELQEHVLQGLRAAGIGATFHFQPLHASPYAREFLGLRQSLPVTERAAQTILRLPLHAAMERRHVERVLAELERLCR